MAADGTIVIDVTLDDGSVVQGLANINGQLGDTGQQGSSMFGKIGKGMKTAALAAGGLVLGVGAIGAAAIGLAAPFVRAAGDLQALNAQFSTVFGELEKSATESLDKIGAETGVATGRLKGTFTQMAAFAKTSGASTADALDISSRATLAAADSAAFYDRSIEDVSENLQSFLKGNFENDAALGISATEFTRNSAAADLFGKKFKDLSELQKQQTLLKMVEDGNKLGGAMGQAARETDGLENVIGNLKDAWETLKATIGEQILDYAINGIKMLTSVINNFDITPFVAAFDRVKEVLTTVFQTVMPIITSQIAGLKEFWASEGDGILTTVTEKFNLIKDKIFEVINIILPFVQEQLSKLKNFWDENGEQILTAVKNAFEGVKKVVDFLMPAIKLVIEVIWGAIKNVITGALDVIMGAVKVFSGLFTGDFSKMWEGIKQVFSGAIDLILGFMTLTFFGGIRTLFVNLGKTGISLITKLWDGLKGLFSSGSGNINTLVSTLVSNVIKFFKDLFTNTTQTVTQLAIDVVSAIGKMADDMIALVKDLPSKFLTYGKNIVQGLIDGIAELSGKALKAIGDLATGIIEKVTGIFDVHSPSRVMKAIGSYVGEGLAIGIAGTEESNEKAITGVATVLSNAAKNVAKEVTAIATKAEVERSKIQKTYADKRAKANVKNNEKTKKGAKKVLVDINKINQQEQEALKKITDKANKDIKSKEAVLYSERLKAVKDYVEDKKSTDELSLVAEAEVYRKSLALFKEGSKERVAIQKAQKETIKKINDEIIAINTNYTGKINDVNQKFNDESKRINDEYNSQLSSRINTLRNFKSLFDEFTIDYEVSGQTLLNNLNAQVSGFKRFQNELSMISNRGISKDLLNELQSLGPNAVSEIAALNRLTDSELTEYSNLFQEKSKLAKEQATKELSGLRKQSDAEISNLRIDAIKEIEKLNVEWSSELKKTTLATDQELSKLKQIGVNAATGLLDGLKSQQSALVSKAKEIGTAIKNALSTSLNGSVNANVSGSSTISNPLSGTPLNLNMNNSSSAVNSPNATKANSTLNNNKTAVNIEPAPVLLDGKKIADVTFQQTSNNIYSATSVNGLMKGVKV